MLTERMSLYALFCEAGNGWKTVRDGQSMAWTKSMRTWTSGLAHVVAFRLLDWGPQDRWKQWVIGMSVTVGGVLAFETFFLYSFSIHYSVLVDGVVR